MFDWFNSDDEEEQKPVVEPVAPSNPERGPPVSPEMMQDRVKKYILDKYKIASDSSGVKTAQSDANRQNTVANVFQALDMMGRAKGQAYGGQGTDSGFYNGLRSQGQEKIKTAESNRANKMSGVLQEQSLNSTLDKAGRDELSNDPSSEKSRAYQGMVRSMAPGLAEKMGPNLDKASAADLEKNFPKLYQMWGKSQGGATAKWQMKDVQNPDGTVGTVRVNVNDGTVVPIDGLQRGYSPKYVKNPYTGAWEQVFPNGKSANSTRGSSVPPAQRGSGQHSPTSAPKPNGVSPGPRPGESPNEYKRRRDVEDAGAKKAVEQDEKDNDAFDDATAQQAKRKSLHDEYIGLYDSASKEGYLGGTGPVGGRVSGLQNSLGFSAGESTDKLHARLTTGLNQYIKDTTGASAGVDEMKRLSSVMPTGNEDRELFINKMRAAEEEADAIIAERRQKAGGAPIQQKQTQDDDVAKYATSHGITYEAAAAIKKARGGK